MDLQLNASRRDVNDSVYLVFDLEIGSDSNFWSGRNELSILDSFLQRVVTVNAKSIRTISKGFKLFPHSKEFQSVSKFQELVRIF